MFNIKNRLIAAEQQLQHISTPTLDAEVLLSYVLDIDRSYLYAHPDQILTNEQITQYQILTKRRQSGEPIAYIVGHQEFWSLDLLVTPDVLIPRAETELLVESVLDLLPNDSSIRIADLGTGSGAVALAIASERSHWKIVATDQSESALKLARRNQQRIGVNSVEFLLSDWCQSLPAGQFDAIVSNPPYVAEEDPYLKQGDVRFEPRAALIAGLDGLQAIQIIVDQAKQYLKTSGYLVFEHGYNQGEPVRKILSNCKYQDIVTKKDLAGHERITWGRLMRKH